MAGDHEVKSLAARRQELVAESEVYRQTLDLELQNMRLYVARMQRGFRLAQAAKPLLFLLPVAAALLGLRAKSTPPPRTSRWKKAIGTLLVGWRLYGRFKPVLETMTFLRRRRGPSAPATLRQS